jgi:uncharacterized protein (UPF0335 family)
MKKGELNEENISREEFEKLISEISHVKNKVDDNDLSYITRRVEQLSDEQTNIKEDLSSVKDALLNPEDGVIVKVNKNTDYRMRTSKAIWVLFMSVLGLIYNSLKDII